MLRSLTPGCLTSACRISFSAVGGRKTIADGRSRHHLHHRLRLEFAGAMPDDRHGMIPRGEQRVDEPADPCPSQPASTSDRRAGQKVVTHLDIRQMAEHHAVRVQRALGISRVPEV